MQTQIEKKTEGKWMALMKVPMVCFCCPQWLPRCDVVFCQVCAAVLRMPAGPAVPAALVRGNSCSAYILCYSV